MPVIIGNPYFQSVDEDITPGQGGSYSLDGHHDYERRFKVVTKIKGLSHLVIENAPGVPRGGTFYITPNGGEWDLLAILTDKHSEPQEKDDWSIWIVTCKYSTKVKSKSDPSAQNNPELERPSVGWKHETVQLAPFRDRYGRPFQSTARMPFSPAPTLPFAYPVLHIGRNELTHDVVKGMAYSYALNARPFLGFPRGCVQCLPPDADQSWKGAYRFWKMGYQLRFAPLIPKNKAEKFIAPGGLTIDDFMPPIPAKLLSKIAADYGVTEDEMSEYRFLGWQPIYLNQSLYRLKIWPPPENPAAAGPPPKNVNEPTPILKGPVPIAHPDLIDNNGQPVKKDPVTGFREPWYIGFVEYRYLDMVKLMSQGLQS